MQRIREKSRIQTQFLLEMLDGIDVVTSRNPDERGCQLSLRIGEGAELLVRKLEERGIVCDFRPPNIVRVSPSPLYNSFDDLVRFSECLLEVFFKPLLG